MKADVRNHEEMVKEKQQFLENEMDNNQEEQKKIKASDRLVAKLRLDYQDNETQRISFTDEVGGLGYCQISANFKGFFGPMALIL